MDNRATFLELADHLCYPEWKDYCVRKDILLKILLMIDNAPAHQSYLVHLTLKVKVLFLPNTTTLIQPLDQGVITAFKEYYLCCTFKQLIDATDGESKTSIREFWKSFNFLNVVDIVGESWRKVT